MRYTPSILDPLSIRGVTFRNRLWASPMCQFVAGDDALPTDWHLVHLGAMARGVAGAVIVEATAVSAEGRISPRDLGLWNPAQEDALRRIAEFAREQGAAIGIQLSHAGRKGSTWLNLSGYSKTTIPIVEGGWATVAPSSIPYPGLAAPHPLTQGQICVIVEQFRSSARRAVHAGFDFIELHSAHGYLLHQFLSPLSNRRDDGYGGCLVSPSAHPPRGGRSSSR